MSHFVILFGASVLVYEELRRSRFAARNLLSESNQEVMSRTPSLLDFLFPEEGKEGLLVRKKEGGDKNIKSNGDGDNKDKIIDSSSKDKNLGNWKIGAKGEPQWGCVRELQRDGLFVQIHLVDSPPTWWMSRVEEDDTLAKRAIVNAAAAVLRAQEEKGGIPPANVVVGFGARVWRIAALKGAITMEEEFQDLKPRRAIGFSRKEETLLPATGGDIFLHIKGPSLSQCVKVSQEIISSIPSQSIKVIDEVYGYTHQTQNEAEGKKSIAPQYDLSGVPINVANPNRLETRCEAALIPEIGGSFCLVQQWVHKFDRLPMKTGDKERIFGSQTPSLDAKPLERLGALPKGSHPFKVFLLDPESVPFSIVRQSLSWGRLHGNASTAGNGGLMFCAYSKSPRVFNFMLDSMTSSSIDPIFSFTECLTGNIYYCPSKQQLTKIATSDSTISTEATSESKKQE